MKQMVYKVTTLDEQETFNLGFCMGKNLLGGEIFILDGDLGSGKTALAKGLAAGIGSTDIVASPTFTVEHVYKGERLEMHHYDFYRLGELGLMQEELQEVLRDNNAIIVVEWPEASVEIMPKEKLLHVQFSKDATRESVRHMQLEITDVQLYIIDNVIREEIQ